MPRIHKYYTRQHLSPWERRTKLLQYLAEMVERKDIEEETATRLYDAGVRAMEDKRWDRS